MANDRYTRGDPYPSCRRCGRDLEHYPGQWLRSTCGPEGCEREFHSWDRGRMANRPLPADVADMVFGSLSDDGTRDRSTITARVIDRDDLSDIDPVAAAEVRKDRADEDALWNRLAADRKLNDAKRFILECLERSPSLLWVEINRLIHDGLARTPERMRRQARDMLEAEGLITVTGYGKGTRVNRL